MDRAGGEERTTASSAPPKVGNSRNLSLFHHVSRKASCASRGSPTPSLRKPLKSNSRGELSVLILFVLLKVLNISTVGIKVKRSPILKSRSSRQSKVK